VPDPVHTFVPGIYPRSEGLVQATRDLDRGRTTLEAVDAQLVRDLEELVTVQQQAGLDLLADGMLQWQDLFRPLIQATDGLEPGPLTRFLDTNTFYRAPTATAAKPRLRGPLDDDYVAPLPGPRLITLPSPFAFAKGTELSPRAIAEGVLKPALAGVDAELVVLSEPFLARESAPDLDELAEALEQLSGGPPLVLQLAFGPAGHLFPRVAELPVHGIGVDFYATRLEDVPDGFEKLLLAGVVDARSSLLEDADELVSFVGRLDERVVGDIALVPNGDLQYVTERIAREKVTRLGATKRAVLEAAA
jgi:5-methyltetrahydropteroyltriglutamate--homocysteine methyltransferase